MTVTHAQKLTLSLTKDKHASDQIWYMERCSMATGFEFFVFSNYYISSQTIILIKLNFEIERISAVTHDLQ
jgi:hypothetical protein